MTTLYVDADACPVKDEVYRVAARYRVPVFVVSNSWMHVPADGGITRIVVDGGPDAADNWIAERAREGDVVVTTDIPLADRRSRPVRKRSTQLAEYLQATASEAPLRRE